MADEPVFTAQDLVTYLHKRGRLPSIAAPETAILLYQKEIFAGMCRKSWRRTIPLFGAEMLPCGHFGIFGKFGAGAPSTAALVEQLIAFGVKRFVSIGLAGGLQEYLNVGDLIIGTGAIRNEGLTRHYLPPAEIVRASSILADTAYRKLAEGGIPFYTGLVWTTDAPFREMKKDVLHRQQSGAMVVDMEAAALLGVAGFYGLQALSLFSVADSLAGGIWKMPDNLTPALNGLKTLLRIALTF